MCVVMHVFRACVQADLAHVADGILFGVDLGADPSPAAPGLDDRVGWRRGDLIIVWVRLAVGFLACHDLLAFFLQKFRAQTMMSQRRERGTSIKRAKKKKSLQALTLLNTDTATIITSEDHQTTFFYLTNDHMKTGWQTSQSAPFHIKHHVDS